MNYATHYSTKKTSQLEKIPGSDQIMNNAGGFAWKIDDWARLDRFLVLGSQGGTYYVGGHELTVDNADAVVRCIKKDGERVVGRVCDVSLKGRAPSNDPALFVLALAASFGDDKTRKAALNALPSVARIGTHLFHFAEYVNSLRGWGRGLRKAVSGWYDNKDIGKLAYDVVKYQQRDGWSHRDLLRLSHPVSTTAGHSALYKWITSGSFDDEMENVPYMVRAFERAKLAADKKEVCSLILEHGLPREAIPTSWLNEPDVWRALLAQNGGMPMTAMLRNLANMTRLGVLENLSEETKTVASRLVDRDCLKAARVHPISILVALKVYNRGTGLGGRSWTPVSDIVDALNDAFYISFDNVEPTGKRIVLAVDVSGSMVTEMASGVSCREAAAAIAMVTHKTEENSCIISFQDKIVPLEIGRYRRIDDVIKATSNLPFGSTDCSAPMLWAIERNIEADAFVVITDNETWRGNIHPSQTIAEYRRRFGVPAKLVVVGMAATEFSIADPNDAGMLDVVGFDTTTPSVISDFIRRS
jgi:60 kDa SS-A/Ro ribonucleoprotein